MRKLLTCNRIIQKLMLRLSETTEEGEWYNLDWTKNINYWPTQIPYNNNRLDTTTSSRTWHNKKGLLYK